MMFSSINLSRLTTPLCLNYLAMVHLDNQLTPRTTMRQEAYFTEVRLLGEGATLLIMLIGHGPSKRFAIYEELCDILPHGYGGSQV